MDQVLESLKQAIFGQESSSGKADTSKPNYAGARGPMQMTEPTFEGLKKQGLIPADWRWDNPEHNKEAGFRHIEDLYNRYGKDPAKVAAVYVSGPKAVSKDGKLVNYADKLNPKHTTMRYISDVLGRMGAAPEAAPKVGLTPSPVAYKDNTQPTPSPTTDASPGLAADQARMAHESGISFVDQVKAGWRSSLPAVIYRKMTEPEHLPTPGYDPVRDAPALFENVSADDYEDLRSTNSLAHTLAVKADLDAHKARMDELGAHGVGRGLAAGLIGGLPEGAIAGLAAVKVFRLAGVGASMYAQQGRTATAAGSLVAENVLGNVATTGALDALGEHQSVTDYAMGMGAGVIFGGLGLRGIMREADAINVKLAGERIVEGATQALAGTYEAAVRKLGPDAEPAALRAEVTRLEGERVKDMVQAGDGEVSPDRRLLPPDEDTPEASLDAPNGWGSTGGDGFVKGAPPKFSLDEAAFFSPAAIPDKVGPAVRAAAQAVEDMRKLLPPGMDLKVAEITGPAATSVRGSVVSSGEKIRIGFSEVGNAGPRGIETAMHEVTHAITDFYFPNVEQALRSRILADYNTFVQKALDKNPEAILMRWADPKRAPTGLKDGVIDVTDKYQMDFGEWAAEQGVKYFKADAAGVNSAGFRKSIVDTFKDWAKRVISWFTGAKEAGHIPATESFKEFLDKVVAGEITPVVNPERHTRYSLGNEPIANKYGLNLMPMDTPQQQAEYRAILHLYTKADEWARAHPMDEDYLRRVSSITDNALFNVASTSLLMLKSKNPVVRMLAAELIESPAGAGGRQTTAAMGKYIAEGKYMGNSINDFQAQYRTWRNANGGHIGKDILGDGDHYRRFSRLVAEEVESRQPGRTRAKMPETVVKAADVLEAAYERMRVDQIRTKTVGWASLPETSVGYMPHRLSPDKVINMTNGQKNALHSALTDQFINIEGWDMSFADKLASKYIDLVQQKAYGSYATTAHGSATGAADTVQAALEAMGMTRQEVYAAMQKFHRGGAGHTKRRLRLDLLAEHSDAEGQSFRMLDFYETDPMLLLRSQAQRVSGEVALARHGVMGKAHLDLLRRAMEFGETGAKADTREVAAFDQVVAEFLGQPFGTHLGKWADRALTANSLARLGGMVFTQASEFINALVQLGAGAAGRMVAGVPRLSGEVRALARGEVVNNPLLTSLEHVSGREFGTDAYKLVFPFDSGNASYNVYGRDTLTATDRLLRAGAHAQGKLSMWRAMHSAQQRGVAEQIVRKAVRYIAEGKEDKALADMGFTPDLVSAIKADLPNIAQFAGRDVAELDLTKTKMPSDKVAAFVQAVHRGSGQIIQQTFIGETGKWAHDDFLKIITQFRTFSITSMEKQWTRNTANFGTAKAWGILAGAMSVAWPLYVARVYANSLGRADQEEYLEKNLSTGQVARATLNYVAMSGLAGDFLDAFTAVSGLGEYTGGRSGAVTGFVGNVIAPSAGYVDDVWQSLQNNKEGTDPSEFLRSLPFSKLPYMIPIINALGDAASQ